MLRILFTAAVILLIHIPAQSQPKIKYTISVAEPATHFYTVDGIFKNINADTLVLKLPNWMPGYYQLMDYAKSLQLLTISDEKGKTLPYQHPNDHTFIIPHSKNKTIRIIYNFETSKQFVANSYVDTGRAYIIPANSFLYPENQLNQPVQVDVTLNENWKDIATGLDPVIALTGRANTKKIIPNKQATNFAVKNLSSSPKVVSFLASDFDVLYDSPILIGNLEELPSFTVKGIPHYFKGYKTGSFDKIKFMDDLKKIVETASSMIGDIPYSHYTFIAIGPGRGGIEHLNNTTISFDGNSLNDPASYNRMMNFIAHEYFHHYNVKRIRPLELGPFDYEKGNRTNLLWVSEGLSVYYEYLVVKRAGLMTEDELLKVLSGNITSVENNPGKNFQSLQQASYNTWSDGPFGTQGRDPNKAISYYDKGPVAGLLLDFEIRNSTRNKRSLDDVMKLLYWKYYKEKGRGFTEAEFQHACEEIASKPLSEFFEYVYTTKELEYDKYLAFAGLKLNSTSIQTDKGERKQYRLERMNNSSKRQEEILQSWLGK
jgi:predicted metalloprotease with PDZ domain